MIGAVAPVAIASAMSAAVPDCQELKLNIESVLHSLCGIFS
jgi:hypothetical protein